MCKTWRAKAAFGDDQNSRSRPRHLEGSLVLKPWKIKAPDGQSLVIYSNTTIILPGALPRPTTMMLDDDVG